MNPFQPPFPTSWNLPFQPATGSQISVLISESLEGAMVMETRQNAGKSEKDAFPSGALNCPAGTTCAEVIVVCGSFSAVSFPHEAASAPCAALASTSPRASTVTLAVPAT